MSIEIKELDDLIAQWEASILTGIAETINSASYNEVDRAVVCGLVSVLGLSLMEHVMAHAAAKEANTAKAGNTCH
ncbi:hypothetical protein QZJ86_05735 [Methylomonas montana]|uniref:hypothetical protein n=1 Tax=Methylomonas montana TaxID=3058963 RepID=UPI00265AE2EA|nr:hypothetical protein [Methylomonas montana]WKJ91635.1 hypothetical protein QZJ86_05735 [Methylomonas montana]